jgi:hypothetical protein
MGTLSPIGELLVEEPASALAEEPAQLARARRLGANLVWA